MSSAPPAARSRSRRASSFFRTALSLAIVVSGAVIGGSGAAHSAPGDDAEASAQLIEADLLSLDLVDAIRVESGSPSDPVARTGTIDVALLEDLIELDLGALGIPLINNGSNNGLLHLGDGAGLGLLNGYAYAPDANHATAASGAVTNTGAIDVDAVSDPTSMAASVELTALLDQLGLAGLSDLVIDDLSLQLGALASTATAETGQPVSSSYAVADAKVVVSSPMLVTLTDTIDTAVTTLDTTLDGLLGPTGAVQTALNGLSLQGLSLLGIGLSFGTPQVSASVDLSGVVSEFTTGAIVGGDGLVTLDLDNGDIIIDLEQLHGGNLNGLGQNAQLLTSPHIIQITSVLNGLLGDIVGDVTDAVDTAVNSTAVTIAVSPSVSALGVVTSDLAISVGGTVGSFLAPTPASPAVSVTGGVHVALLPPLLDIEIEAGQLLTPITNAILTPILGAVGNAIEPVLTNGGGVLETALNGVVTPLLTTLSPLLSQVLDQIVDIRVNSQSTAAGAFTVRALLVEVLPGAGAVALPLASSTVRVAAVDEPSVADSLAPTSGPEAGGTEVTISGSGFTGATGVTFDDLDGVDFVVVDDSTITVTTPPHAAGLVDVVVLDPAGDSDPLTFEYLAVVPEAPVITSITPGSGPETGGTGVTIVGTGFTGATAVSFGSGLGTDLVVVDDSMITVTTQAHAPEVVDVVIASPNGDSAPGVFEFVGVAADAQSITPAQGPESGGTPVEISGSGFTGATSVTFDDVAGTGFVVVSDSLINVTTPPHAPGVVDVVVLDPAGDSDPLAFEYLLEAVPVAISLDPTSGSESGGTAVTIAGSGFVDATGVTFDGIDGTDFVVVDDATITVSTPAHAPGTVDVIVESPNGDSNALEFTYLADAPVAISLDPTSGPENGGTPVTILGSGFADATSVTFGAVDGFDLVVVDDTTITVTTPAHAPGMADVVVVGPAGSSDPLAFEFLAVAAVADSLDPTSGPEIGGTVVTVSGSGFTGATGVEFDGIEGTGFVVVSDSEIVVTTPAHAPGAVDVVVVDPAGDSAPLEFTYVNVPSVATGLSPTSGPESGGTVVTVSGSGFTGATGVEFDGVEGTGFVVVSDSEITVTTPAHVPGVVDVIVVDPGGDSGALDFEYVSAPSVATSLTPVSGPESGGTAVTITGSGFTGAVGVLFGSAEGIDVVVVSDTTITVTTPVHAPGVVDVVVVDPAGDSAPLEFEFVAVPSAAVSLTPTSGPDVGGTVVIIEGSGFLGATGVTFDGLEGTDFVVVSDTTITVTTPAHAPGVVDVIVVDPAGDSGPLEFEFLAVPSAVESIDPTSGPETGGTVVTIVGEGFTGSTGVDFGDVPGTDFQVVDDNTITVTTPPHAPGVVDVVVLDPAGDSDPVDFEFLAMPSVAMGLDPESGPETGGTVVTITGYGFLGATGVTFDGLVGADFQVIDDETIVVTTPPHVPGIADVVVVDPAGNSTALEFEFIAVDDGDGDGNGDGDGDGGNPSDADTVTPDSGPTTGGTVVTIIGAGFTGATGVTFDGIPGTGFVVVDDNTIRVTTPPHAAGVVDVVVIDPDGNSAPLRFTYRDGAKPGLPDTGAMGSVGLAGLNLLFAAGAAGAFAMVRPRRD